jgi:uncharacterized protein YqhQ
MSGALARRIPDTSADASAVRSAILFKREGLIALSVRRFFQTAAHLQLLPALMGSEETLVGGQAVMEGVMMRAPHSYCVAVRQPDGVIVQESLPVPKLSEKYRLWKLPILRGMGTLGQAMYLGIKALNFSANASLGENERTGKKQEISSAVLGLNLLFSFSFFVFLYKFVPLYAATWLGDRFPVLKGRIALNMTDGIIRILIFLAFLYGVSRWKDIRRVFEYHGAEHKVVFNYESGKPVNLDNARGFATFHPRCGTSFLLVVMVIAIAVYTFIPFDGFFLRFLFRILLLPLIAGISYELIRFSAKHRDSFLAALTAPGLWLQRITTQPPADDQLAVAIQALEGAMALEQEQGGELVVA